MAGPTLRNRVALVTGGTRGIGLAIARSFLDEDATVAMMGRNPVTGTGVVAELGAGDNLMFVQGDVTDRTQMEAAIDAVVDRHGRLDVLVNNAGGMPSVAPVIETTDDQWMAALAWNLTSVFVACRHAVPVMRGQGWGRIINVSSFRAKQPAASQAPYSAAKAGVNALTKALALEVGDFGVTVNAICPGLVLTDFSREAGATYAASMGFTAEELWERHRRGLPSRELPTTAMLGRLAVFLASEVASCISGSSFTVDGGAADY